MTLLYVFTRSAWQPAVEIYQSGDRLLIIAEVPGCRPEQLTVTVERNRVILTGTREPPVLSARWLRGEIAWGPFERVITLPMPVDPERARAESRDGLLLVSCPTGTATSAPIRLAVDVRE
jgi:HSP20 family protein